MLPPGPLVDCNRSVVSQNCELSGRRIQGVDNCVEHLVVAYRHLPELFGISSQKDCIFRYNKLLVNPNSME